MATDWRAAGIKADAHRVVAEIRSGYTARPKELVRARAIKFLAGRSPDLVLDAWGGGLSAEQMTDAGLRVLSVDDGRFFANVDVSKARGFRAMQIAGEERGYQTARGSLREHAHAADAAFLDFCGHWSSEVERTVRACAHMKAVVVTLMPERMALGSLSAQSWSVAYRALLETHSGMRVRWHVRYVRSDSGLTALVYALDRSPARAGVVTCALSGCDLAPWGGAKSKFCSIAHKQKHRYMLDADRARSRARDRRAADPDKFREMERQRRADNAHLVRPPRRCRHCRRMFVPPRQPKAMYCPKPECRHAAYVADYQRKNAAARVHPEPKACSYCGDTFTPTARQARLCSNECRNRQRLERAANSRAQARNDGRRCLECGLTFVPRRSDQKFCQHKHGRLYQQRLRRDHARAVPPLAA